ncbi:AraC family transcriptional regulator [Maricurvus nonylphenolicus]
MILRMLERPRKAGVDIDNLFERCNVNPETLKQPHYRIPVATAVELLQRCGFQMQDEFLGLLAAPIPPGYFRQSVLSTVHQPTLGLALARYLEFSNIFFNSLRFELKRKKQIVEIICTRDINNKIKDDIAIECSIAVFHRLTGWLCNELIILNNVELDFSVPTYYKEYHYLFYGAPIQFNSNLNRITFDAHYLDLPIVQTEASAEIFIRRAPLDIFLPQDVQGEMSREIHEALRISFTKSQQPAELQDIAEDMGISTQTIRRKLTKEGTSFNNIKSQVRRDIAMHALGNPELSIEEVAIQAGYSEPAAFIRAFKSWTGFTPAKFRQGVI